MAQMTYDLIVIGGGPAGAAVAITAARRGGRVLLLERGRYPRHKVCGEFVSPEALGLLAGLLGSESPLFSAPRIHESRLFLDGHIFTAPLTPAAASISRLELDAALWRAAENCAECREQTTAERVDCSDQMFTVLTSGGELRGRFVVDCSGRWSNLNRGAAQRGWLGLKAHFACEQDQRTTDLYFFRGGYCGVQPVARGRLNVCAMVRADTATSLEQVFSLHPQLARASRAWRSVMDPVAISPLVFRPPTPDRNGMLCAGDAAGFVDPFIGDGIALALRTGIRAAEILCDSGWDTAQAIGQYRAAYARQFAPLFRRAARLRRLLSMPALLRAPFLPMLHLTPVSIFLVKHTRPA